MTGHHFHPGVVEFTTLQVILIIMGLVKDRSLHRAIKAIFRLWMNKESAWNMLVVQPESNEHQKTGV